MEACFSGTGLRIIGVFCLVAAVTPQAASGQAIRASATSLLATRYVFRGVTRVSRPVLQGEGRVAAQWAEVPSNTQVSVGIWANLELSSPGTATLSDRGSGAGAGLGEWNLDLSAATTLGALDLAGGVIRYEFNGDSARGGRGTERNTTELYAVVQARRWPLAPAVTIALDVEAVRGAYLQVEGFHALAMLPGFFLSLRPALGVSLGQGRSPGEAANFSGDGLAFVAGTIAGEARFGALAIVGTATLQGNVDDATRVTSGDAPPSEKSFKAWLTFGGRVVLPGVTR